jgi:plastocyanin domain-containing protein
MTDVQRVLKFGLAVLLTGLVLTAARPFAAEPSPRVVKLSLTDKGFEPSSVKVKKDEPLKLIVTRKTDNTCAKEIVVKEYDIQKELPLNKPVEVEFTPTKAGKLRYGCSMGMMIGGVLLVE